LGHGNLLLGTTVAIALVCKTSVSIRWIAEHSARAR
jgi:hypothetical protein